MRYNRTELSGNIGFSSIIDEKFKNNRVINPTREEIDRMVFLRYPGDAVKLFDDAWKNVKGR